MAHSIVHVEIPTDNPGPLSKFYAAALGWQMETDSTYNYTQWKDEGGSSGGFSDVNWVAPNQEFHQRPGELLIYLGSADIDADLAKVEAAGGKILLPNTEIPGIGWWGAFEDPSGNRLAFFTPAPRS